jgi:hypothetical protein
MAIQDLPTFFDMVYTKPDGHLAADGYLYNDQMYQALNLLVNTINLMVTTLITNGTVLINGINPPIKTTAQITALLPNVPIGTIWYNSNLKKLQFKSDTAVVETITST